VPTKYYSMLSTLKETKKRQYYLKSEVTNIKFARQRFQQIVGHFSLKK